MCAPDSACAQRLRFTNQVPNETPSRARPIQAFDVICVIPKNRLSLAHQATRLRPFSSTETSSNQVISSPHFPSCKQCPLSNTSQPSPSSTGAQLTPQTGTPHPSRKTPLRRIQPNKPNPVLRGPGSHKQSINSTSSYSRGSSSWPS